MLEAVADITEALRSALVTVEGSSNTFGDAQLSVDVIADEIMWAACRDSAVVAYGASEEEPEVRKRNSVKRLALRLSCTCARRAWDETRLPGSLDQGPHLCADWPEELRCCGVA